MKTSYQSEYKGKIMWCFQFAKQIGF